ncbi:MAG: ParB/RepB/Spo0J family partition protein [Desulfuromonadia bacterium]
MARKGLGKGIGALLPAAEEDRKSFFLCPIESIRPHAGQPRKNFDPDKLKELTDSIREKGIIQPLIVRERNGWFELIAGERRWRAAQKAGLHDVPVVVKDAADGAAFEMALIENIQREDLNAIEEAMAYQALMEQFGLSQEEVARRVGKDRSTVTNMLRLLRLPDDIQRDIVEDRITMGHARAILSLDETTLQRVARDQVVSNRLSVRATERLVTKLKSAPAPDPGEKRGGKDIHLTEIEQRLRQRLSTRVAIRRKRSGGVIEISFASFDELERLLDRLG